MSEGYRETDRRTDGNEEENMRPFFCEYVNEPKNCKPFTHSIKGN